VRPAAAAETGGPEKDIWFYINSPALGHRGLAIYDTMQLITNDVATVALGMAASMASSC